MLRKRQVDTLHLPVLLGRTQWTTTYPAVLSESSTILYVYLEVVVRDEPLFGRPEQA
jgi:hypothetical protein